MNKTWMPAVGGSLSIIAGAARLLVVLGLIIAMSVTGDALRFTGVYYWAPVDVLAILWIITVPFAVSGILAVVGGIYAIQRRSWGLALAGSIAAIFPVGILGIAAVVFTALSKDSFRVSPPVAEQESQVIEAAQDSLSVTD